MAMEIGGEVPGEGTQPKIVVHVNTPPFVQEGEHHVSLGFSEGATAECRITFDDFLEMMAYFLTNTDLVGPQDLRAAFISWARTLEVTSDRRSEQHVGNRRIHSPCAWPQFAKSAEAFASIAPPWKPPAPSWEEPEAALPGPA